MIRLRLLRQKANTTNRTTGVITCINYCRKLFLAYFIVYNHYFESRLYVCLEHVSNKQVGTASLAFSQHWSSPHCSLCLNTYHFENSYWVIFCAVKWVSRFLTAHQHNRLYSAIYVGSRWKIQATKTLQKLNTIQKSKQQAIQQNKTTPVQSPLATLSQVLRWAYSFYNAPEPTRGT